MSFGRLFYSKQKEINFTELNRALENGLSVERLEDIDTFVTYHRMNLDKLGETFSVPLAEVPSEINTGMMHAYHQIKDKAITCAELFLKDEADLSKASTHPVFLFNLFKSLLQFLLTHEHAETAEMQNELLDMENFRHFLREHGEYGLVVTQFQLSPVGLIESDKEAIKHRYQGLIEAAAMREAEESSSEELLPGLHVFWH
jgi:hypothetical protein